MQRIAVTRKGVRHVPACIRTAATGIPIMKERAQVVSIKPIALERLLKGTEAPVQELDPMSKEFFETEARTSANMKRINPELAPCKAVAMPNPHIPATIVCVVPRLSDILPTKGLETSTRSLIAKAVPIAPVETPKPREIVGKKGKTNR